ncbi:MAG: hypothetical protein ACOH2R_28670 [Pseudomonas sp.]
MIPESISPSDLLLAVATTIYASCSSLPTWLTGAAIEAWEGRLLERVQDAAIVEEWHLDAVELLNLPEIFALSWPLTPPKTFQEFETLITALQSLDRWHYPLTSRLNTSSWKSGHEAAANKFAVDQHLSFSSEGILVIASPRIDPPPLSDEYQNHLNDLTNESPLSSIPIIAAELLEYTTFLPASLSYEDAAGASKNHLVRFANIRASVPSSRISKSPRIGVIPALEDYSDAKITIYDGLRYSVDAEAVQPKLLAAIGTAILEGAEIILMPEAAVSHKNMEVICNHIRSCRQEFIKNMGSEPKFRLAIIGTTGEEINRVIVLDPLANSILSQDKLFRWDLEPHHTSMYGIAREHNITPRVLKENILNGTELYIIDIEEFGRLAILICADADAKMPGDWCLEYARPDWVYIPILDRSNLEISTKSEVDGRWISRRSARAAYTARCRVISTNSLYMTQRLNSENAITAKYPPVSFVNISLSFDATSEIPKLKQEFVSIYDRGICVCFNWGDGWAPAPNS